MSEALTAGQNPAAREKKNSLKFVGANADAFLLERSQSIQAGHMLDQLAIAIRSARARPWLRPFAIFLCAACLAPAGCNWNRNAKHKDGDPLMGEVHPKERGGDPNPPSNAGVRDNNNTSSSQAPASSQNPQPSASTSTPAFLASRLQPLPQSKELAIKEPDKLHLGQRPLIQPLPSQDNPLVQNAWTAAGNALNSPDRLHEALSQRGVFKHEFTPLPDGVRLTAFVSRPGDDQNFQIVETTGRDPTAAMQTLLHQLEKK
jgi:hypothetical protein